MRVDRCFPGLQQLAIPLHRRSQADGGPDRAGHGREGGALRAAPGRVRAGADARAREAAADDLVARLEGKSSLGRLGLVIHRTAGFVDPGFEGNLTLELSNLATLPITIYHGMPIGQISFMRMDGPVEHPYGGEEAGSQVPGPGRADGQPLLPQLRPLRRPAESIRPAGGRPLAGTIGLVPNIGPLEIAIVLVIVLIIFGPKRLPELGRSHGPRHHASSGARSPGSTRTRTTSTTSAPSSSASEAAEAKPAEPVEGEVVTEKRA